MKDEELPHLAFKRAIQESSNTVRSTVRTRTRARARAVAGQWAVEVLLGNFALRISRVRSGSGLSGFVLVGSR